jgi:ABC-type dipeptide/oligopeptide/nickel transport system permease component
VVPERRLAGAAFRNRTSRSPTGVAIVPSDSAALERMGIWVEGLARGDLGRSLWTREPTAERLWAAIPVSAELAFGGLALAVSIAVPLAILSAVRQDTWTDHGAQIFAILGISVPDSWVGTLLIPYFSLAWGYLPPLGDVSLFDDPFRNLQQFGLPVLVLGLRLSATTACGVGLLTFSSIGFRDYPQIQANVLFLSGTLMFLNLLVDMAYAWPDPRIRYQ